MSTEYLNLAIAIIVATFSAIWLLITLQISNQIKGLEIKLIDKHSNIIAEFRAHEATDEAHQIEVIRRLEKIERNQ